MSWRAWRWNRDRTADLWKEPPLYRRCSPSHTNTIWLPLPRRRPHTCTTQRNSRRLCETVLNQSSDLYLCSFDAAKFLILYVLKFCFAEFFLITLFFSLLHLDKSFETFAFSSAHCAVGAVANPIHRSSTSDFTNLFFPLILSFDRFPLSPPLCLAALCRAPEHENSVKDDFKKIS